MSGVYFNLSFTHTPVDPRKALVTVQSLTANGVPPLRISPSSFFQGRCSLTFVKRW